MAKGNEAEINMHRQTKPPIYALFNNSQFEIQEIPMDHNMLLFSDKVVEFEYNCELLLSESMDKLSEEFKTALIYFSVLISLVYVCLIGFAGSLYSSSCLTSLQFLLHISINLLLFVLLFFILYMIKKSNRFLLMTKNIFTLYAILANSYFIVCENKVLSSLTSSDYSPSALPLTLILVVFTCSIRNVIFDSFVHYLIIVSHAVFLFSCLNIVYSPINSSAIICECAVVLLILAYQLIETHIYSLRSRSIFWRKYSEEAAVANFIDPDNSGINNFETESEHMIFICEKMRNNIKFAVKAIIFKDIKQRLKETLADLAAIKKIVGHSGIGAPLKLQDHVKDFEDREFINQNYVELSLSNHSDCVRSTTFINLLEHRNVLFPDYGLNELENVLSGVGKNWNFDIWFVQETTGKSLTIVGQYLFAKYGLLQRFKISEDVLERYLHSLEFHYNSNAYHNACHGADVLHSFLYFVINSDVQRFCTPIETLACIVAGLAHDVGHPGLTNRYLVQSRDPIAMQFNDASVLENMHCATIYQFLNKPGHNIFEWVDAEDWICSRKIIIEMVLATDMSKHFEILGKFRTRAITLSDINLEKLEDKILVFSAGLKCADIGHSAKYSDLHHKWTKLVTEEFFKQGDLEKMKKLPVSMYCDRVATNIPKSQAGFLKNICLPLFEAWVRYINTEPVSKCLVLLKQNLEMWEISGKARRSTQLVFNETLAPFNPQVTFGGSAPSPIE